MPRKEHKDAKAAKAETAELLPPESNVSRVIHSDAETVEKVKRYHMTAERCANLSVWCAAMAGAEMLCKKQQLGHGNGFEDWKEQLPFGRATAARYMKLAEALQEKLGSLPKAQRDELIPALKGEQDAAQKALSLLNLPDPMDVFNPIHDRIAKVIHHVTSGSTLRQLYFDWGIMPQPKRVELLKGPPVQLDPGETMAHRTAVETFDAHFNGLWQDVRDYKQHLHLDVSDLQRYAKELLDLKREFDRVAARG